MKKIFFVTRQLAKGALLNVNMELAKIAKRNNYDVRFVSITGSSIPGPIYEGVVIKALNLGRVRDYFKGFYVFLREERPDAVFVSGYLSAVIFIISSLFVGFSPRIVFQIHEVTSKYIASRKSFVERFFTVPLMKIFFGRCVSVIAVSDPVARDFEKLLSWNKGTVKTLHNSFDIDKINSLSTSDIEACAELNDLHCQPMVLCAGRLEPEKRFEDLVIAFSKLRKKINCRLVMLGEGSQKQDLNDLAIALGVGDRVVFKGFVENPFVYMRKASVLVVTSEREGVCNVLVEAMACGCAVISTRCGGPEDILRGGLSPNLVDVGDVDSLCLLMEKEILGPANKEIYYQRAKDFDSNGAAAKSFEGLLRYVFE